MSEEMLSKEILNRYLLGNLSESEAEAVEACYFADPDYLCELLTACDDLLDAGLRGELSALEAQQLSARLQVLPGLRDKAAFAHSLQQALAQPAERNDRASTPTASAISQTKAASLLVQSQAWFTLARWPGAAAALFLLLCAAWLGLNLTQRWRATSSQKVAQSPLSPTPPTLPTEIEKQTPGLPGLPNLVVAVTPGLALPKPGLPAIKPSPTTNKRETPVAAFVLAAGLVRAGQEAPELDIAATTKTINLQLELAPPLERPQQARLQNEDGALVWEQSPLRLQTYNGVRVAICLLPAHILSAGAYQLRLSQPGGREAIYYFRLKKS